MFSVPVFESIARLGIAILVNGLWQGALIAGVAWLALRVFSKANASTRYAVWALALAAIVVVPVATSLSRVLLVDSSTTSTSAVRSHAISAPRHVAVASKIKHPTSRTVAPTGADAAQSGGASEQKSARPFRLTLPTLFAAVAFGMWILAALVVLARLAIALVSLERLKRDALPLGVAYRDEMPRWDSAIKGHRDVRLCVSDAVEVPVAIGLFDAMILLPSHLVQSLAPAEIDQISLHELAHLLRADDWTNGLQRLACALLFFNPAVWLVARQLDIEREVACDDFVLQLTGEVRPYAFCLTKMVEMTAWPHRAVPAPGVFVTRKNISIRIERLLRTGRAIGSSISPTVAVPVLATLVAIFFVLRTMTPSIAFTDIPVVGPAPTVAAIVSPAPARTSAATKLTIPAVDIPAKTIVIPAQTVRVPAVHVHASTFAMPNVGVAVQNALRSSTASVSTSIPHVSCEGCDYSHASLAGKDFSNRSMQGTNFSHADLHGARFDHASLTGVNFEGADLRNASFIGADLEGCNMRHAGLEGARFDGATLTGCDIDARALSPEQARVVLTSCEGCNFAHADLHGMDLRNVRLEGANLNYADLRNADLSGAMFTGVNFAHAQLSGARVDNAEFIGCDFNGADLRNVDLSKASITGSAIGGAIMRN